MRTTSPVAGRSESDHLQVMLRRAGRVLAAMVVLGAGALHLFPTGCPMAVATLAAFTTPAHHGHATDPHAPQDRGHDCACPCSCCLVAVPPGPPTGAASVATITTTSAPGLASTPGAWLVVAVRLLPFPNAPPSSLHA